MNQDIKDLYGMRLAAKDGVLGHVADFYFDDTSWLVRYVVADTGSWLTGRSVLLAPPAFGLHPFGGEADLLDVNLTCKQVEGSPSIELHRPVSRQHEDDYYRYYGWPAYWHNGGMWSAAGFPPGLPPFRPADPPHLGHDQRDEIHLRSTKAVTGYHIHAIDGVMGSVSSFILDGASWAIRELTVETGHWYAGKTIRMLPTDITRISYEESSVFVNLSLEDLKHTHRSEVAHASAA